MSAAEEFLPASSLDAYAFLRLLAGDVPVTFQTFDDTGAKRPGLARVLHGSLDEHTATLTGLNARGAGVFWMVNEGDRKGRTSANVQRIRAFFVDLDGAPLEPVLSAPLPPHCIVESSANRWHAYWRVADCPLADFTRQQKMLASRFAADPSVCDLPRVMRLPGFDHCKGKRFRTHIVELSERPPYLLAELVAGLHLLEPTTARPMPRTSTIRTQRRVLPSVIPEGERSATLLSLAAGFVRKGHSARAVKERLQRINGERCRPPLCATEVEDVASRALAYGSDGFFIVSHKLWDSPEWMSLPPATQSIILTAFRRHDGTEGGIALTWNDFEGRPGFSTKGTFYRHRARAVASGIVRKGTEGRYTRDGKKPDLFTIAPQWLYSSQVSKLKPCASVENTHPYIDRQSVAILQESCTRGTKETHNEADA